MSHVSYERYTASLSNRELALKLRYAERLPEDSPMWRALIAERERDRGK
jgi:hypothetical protein